MADNTKIEWADASWNPIRALMKDGDRVGWHCAHVSEGCRNCYAETLNKRLGTGLAYQAQNHVKGSRAGVACFIPEKALDQPLKWRRPRHIFVCSMTDLFGDFVTDQMIDRVFAVMALAPQHTFLVLTKRAERMRDYLTAENGRAAPGRQVAFLNGIKDEIRGGALRYDALAHHVCYRGWPIYGEAGEWPLPNVWLGISAEDQTRADERIPLLLDTPAAKRFVSLEPLLGPMDLGSWLEDGIPTKEQVESPRGLHYLRHGAPRLDWVIVGGESGAGARPLHPQWARDLRDQCKVAGVPFFFKQAGEWTWSSTAPGQSPTHWLGPSGTIRPVGSGVWASDIGIARVGKKAAGRLLDGREWSEFPA